MGNRLKKISIDAGLKQCHCPVTKHGIKCNRVYCPQRPRQLIDEVFLLCDGTFTVLVPMLVRYQPNVATL
jgi:hypothetical protein